ncbi:BCCT family transporter, partial [Acinetobacter baumannii]|nr:BCCT family transporter [Acinetobacter baumannii]
MRATDVVGANTVVSIISKVLVLIFILFCAIYSDQAGKIFAYISGIILENMKWFILASTTGFVFFLLYLMGSRYGLLKFGKDDDKPEYSFFAWISMLFSCAMGVGLVFWG